MEPEDWLEEIKKIAEEQAELFVDELQAIADNKNIDREWFLSEAIKNVKKYAKEAESE